MQVGITGYVHATTKIIINPTKVSECYNKATIIKVNANNWSGYVGGIAGGINCEGAEISYCYNMGNINSLGYWTGGIAGDVTRGAKIKNCYNRGSIITEQERSEADYIGGIVGNSYYDINDVNSVGKISEVLNCYNLGNVFCKNSSNTRYVGGIMGLIQNGYVKIDNNYNQAMVSASASGAHLGGIIGIIESYNQITVTNCASGIEPAIGTNRATGSNITITNVLGGQNNLPNILSVINANKEEKFKEDSNNINEGYPILNWQLF